MKNKSLFKTVFTNSVICYVLFTVVFSIFSSCQTEQNNKISTKLYDGFINPSAEARPFVRWWWNGNKVKAKELERELEVLHKAGFGGVEINPVEMPPTAPKNNDKAVVWMSDEWIDLLVVACKKTKDLGMIADMIIGTGWPFGGEFLELDETCQRVVTHYLPFKGGETIVLDEDFLMKSFMNEYKNNTIKRHQSKHTSYELFHVTLVPENCSDSSEVIDLKSKIDKNGKISYKIEKPGSYNLCYGLLEKNFREVYLGAPGGAGPVMDHYKKDVTYAYLSRLKRISEKTGIQLDELIRALFCDSIEVSGANWTDNFSQLFLKTYGYSLEKWLPFVFYPPYDGYLKEKYDDKFSPEFKDELKRVRFDYNKLLADSFLKSFTHVLKDFCLENNLLLRYQAYGTPFLMGMLEGYMIPDIPESNNWIYSAEMKDSLWQWNQLHGYMTWNMFASSGGHLSGRKIIGCEAMTNLDGVFRTTLEEIKQHDDMNFITGINHTVLHGFNYSPKDAEFPGWMRYGAFFSELNTWWEHLSLWIDYNSRLSHVFQNSQADKSIAIIAPTSDLWGDEGLGRDGFHMKPEYLFKLWEPISQLGYSCEYISQSVLEKATIENASINFGNMNYDLLVLASLKSVSPKAAKAIEKFAASGGPVVVIDQLPTKSLNFTAYKENDLIVKTTMENSVTKHPKSFIQFNRPKSLDNLFGWTKSMLQKTQISPDVLIDGSSKNVYQIHSYTEDKEIYFFTNINRNEIASFGAKFPVTKKYPWIWNPETGERSPYHFTSDPSKLNISLKPLQSLLLVFEDDKPTDKTKEFDFTEKNNLIVKGKWEVEGNRVDGKILNWDMEELSDFSTSKDASQRNFGGKIIYKTSINTTTKFTHINLGNVNEGITELYINGKNAGTKWYGEAIFPVAELLKEGNNTIEIHYTTVLGNYCLSLKNNAAAQYWTKHKVTTPTGLEGPVRMITY